MPEKEMPRTEDWYPRGAPALKDMDQWYGGSSETVGSGSADAGCSTHNPPPRAAGFSETTDKKRRRTKILSLSVCALVFICAVLMVIGKAVDRLREESLSDREPSPQVTEPSLPERENDYEDFRDYFAAYYTESDEIEIPAAPVGGGRTLTLYPQEGQPLSLQEIYERVSPAIVGITAWRDGKKYSWGTGVVFTQDGYIVTNTHIIAGTDAVTVTFPDHEEHTALLVGADSASDIAVLKMDGEGYPFARFGDSSGLRVGDAVAAIGNPLGEEYAGTMTNGIVSAINRSVTNNGHAMTLLQTNAALNEGNSGGPLVNEYGQVIGITNMKIMSVYYSTVEGIGFAIPSVVVKQIADQLMENGIVLGLPTIGIVAGSVSSEAMENYGLPAGLYVYSVSEGSDALKQGLSEGDIILRVNGTPVETVAEVNAIKDGLSVGDTLTLTVFRDGESFEMDIILVDKSVIQD